MSDCRFGVSPVNYPDPDPDPPLMFTAVRILSRIDNEFRSHENVSLNMESIYRPAVNFHRCKNSLQYR